MKMAIWAMGALLALVLLTGAIRAVDDAGVTCPPNNPSCPCSDETTYFKCSQAQPGYACVASGGKHMLVNMIGPDGIKSLKSLCACSNYPGYSEVNGVCVKTTCTDGSNTLQNGDCSATKPKQCSGGSLIDNSSACDCPAGSTPNSNSRTCDPRLGCRWKTITCQTGQECKYDSTKSTDDGTCVVKQGCNYHNPDCNLLSENCDTSTNPDGVCKTKSGCQYSNPACGSGQVCNAMTGRCDASGGDAPVPTITLPTKTIVNSTNTTSSLVGNPLGSLNCCFLPAGGAAAMVGLISYQRLRKKEEE